MDIEKGFNADGLVLSEGYAQTMNGAVLPRLAACRTDMTVAGDGGRPLFTSRFDAMDPVGTVVIVHGFTENADKYAELIHSLLCNRYSVCAYDQRGHGRSWRAEGLDDISTTHVDDFDEYVRDLKCVCDQTLSGMPRPWLLFAHSMGGAVSALFMERYEGVIDRAALCAPMIAANLGVLPEGAARLMCDIANRLGNGKKRIPGSRPYSGPEDFATSCATGRERFDWYDGLKARVPEFRNNGPTYGWTRQAIRASHMVLASGAVERIGVPVRLFTAEDDGSVLPGPQEAFVRRLRDGQRTLVKGSKHEIYRSPDSVLFPWWHGILEFYSQA